MKIPKRVIGSYKCGCSYGSIKMSERLEYCPTYGADIQNEYEDISNYIIEIEKEDIPTQDDMKT